MQNILIDKSTAELIHIDLGIAFEQGKILPTPERIPFRLTQDIVDGFGPCGVEGTFRRSCEVTLNVLKAHRDVVMTLLEVLMFDPLFAWSLTPTKAYKLQYGHEPAPEKAKQWKQQVYHLTQPILFAFSDVSRKIMIWFQMGIFYRKRH